MDLLTAQVVLAIAMAALMAWAMWLGWVVAAVFAGLLLLAILSTSSRETK